MSAPLVLCDPPRDPFWPLAATRPVAALLAGTRPFHARWAARLGPVAALWCDAAVAEAAFRSGPAPPRNVWPESGEGLCVAIATWTPPPGWSFGADPAEYRAGDVPVAWRLDAAGAAALGEAPDVLGDGDAVRERLTTLGLPVRDVAGRYCPSIWTVMAANAELIASDAVEFAGADAVTGVDPLVLLGEPAALHVGAGVTIGPFVVLDAREGPIVLDQGARIEPHTVCRGPLYLGPDSVILGGEVGHGTSIGRRCRVRGEVEASIFQGFSNKAHDGFVGHSVLGAWVNLGASTVTSDLKNTYGGVRVAGPGGRHDTGLLKVGAFLGDHVKTGIGTLLTTGARLGVGTHCFGGRGVSPDLLTDFSWYDGVGRDAVRWEPFVAAVETALARRGERLGDGERAVLAARHSAAG